MSAPSVTIAPREARPCRLRAAPLPIRITEQESGSKIELRLGVVTVGLITPNPASNGYFYAVNLPGFSPAPVPARDVETARRALQRKVREWCEAASLVTERRGRQ
ncbi:MULTISPECIES: hypothetical protein [unclassified Bradyrhizobium]|uniref:hypothetical protein n=1 Tax=unclassified Bradyrhizobium TaxID=2631580 RepID=UPI0028E30823|nr:MULTISPECIES: hypothetical protein [unclassified Bradyrhizobium]